MTKNELEDFVTDQLKESSFEQILEIFDLTPQEVFILLFDDGLIDEDIVKSYCEAH